MGVDSMHRWQLFVDTGGTFTDCLGQSPEGVLSRAKVLSHSALRARVVEMFDGRRFSINHTWAWTAGILTGSRCRRTGDSHHSLVVAEAPEHSLLETDGDPFFNPGDTIEFEFDEAAPILGARLLTSTPLNRPLPPIDMRLATTIATNALLERDIEPTAFFATAGFADLLEIGDQRRPDLFAIHVVKPPLIHSVSVEVDERVAADGTVLRPINRDRLLHDARRVVGSGITAAAVCLIHADLRPDHERVAREILLEAGFRHISLSCELSGRAGYLIRSQTAVANAALAPRVESYVTGILSKLQDGRISLMSSSGGLGTTGSIHPKDLLLSGPAGGVIGARAAARQLGVTKVLALDMGGTSTDVSRIDEQLDLRFEIEVGDVSLSSPTLAIETVAAGGGSICWIDGDRLRVGPRSAGAKPGPASYGAGGPLTLTDIHLLMGRLDPSISGTPLSIGAARDALRRTLVESKVHLDESELIAGFMEVANERLTEAIRTVSVRRGFEPADHALLAFGGAGGLHACAIAERLGISSIILPADAGILSARGLAHAAIDGMAERELHLEADSVSWSHLFHGTDLQAIENASQSGAAPSDLSIVRRQADFGYAGLEGTLTIDIDGSDPCRAFTEHYQDVYGDVPRGRRMIVHRIRSFALDRPRFTQPSPIDSPILTERLEGPRLLATPHSSAWIAQGWQGNRFSDGSVLLQNSASAPNHQTDSRASQYEVDICRLEAIARDMGVMLQRTSVSTNVKERLDYSCALLDQHAELIVNAPHVPVHLGSLGVCVRAVRDTLRLDPGDIVITNHPAFGGSHLPDISLVAAVWSDDKKLIGYVAARAHHAEIGGILPGSLPPEASRLVEEGVIIRPAYLSRAGVVELDRIASLLTAGTFPSRAVDDNLADIRAGMAAIRFGVSMLRTYAQHVGLERLHRHMSQLKTRAASLVSDRVARCKPAAVVEALDDGSEIHIRFTPGPESATLNFAGTCSRHPRNLNATAAIVRSAVIYVLRLLAGERVPLNEGLMWPIRLEVPADCMLAPDFPGDDGACPAVGAGNTETSQRLVNGLIRLLGLAADSQGTMNNVVFGNSRFGYYETVGGGVGGSPHGRGADAVHSHMTNTRITDVEIIERRYPVRIDRFRVRRGSGGDGIYQGGDGIERHYRFLEPVSLAVIGQHRTNGPAGASGGAPGRPARQTLLRADESFESLSISNTVHLKAGDQLVLETPGGGGWGTPRSM